jgi:hypothetical protein
METSVDSALLDLSSQLPVLLPRERFASFDDLSNNNERTALRIFLE